MSGLRRYAGSEATTDSERAVGRCATRTEPVARGPCVDCEPCFVQLVRQVCKVAIVRCEHVRLQPGRERFVELHVHPHYPYARSSHAGRG